MAFLLSRKKLKIISTFFQKPLDKLPPLCYNIVVPLMNVINNCWCGSMAEHLICNQAVDGSTPFTSSNKGDFPSGQRGQTVNLLSLTSVVRIHHPPPKNPRTVFSDFFIQAAGLAYHRRTKCGVYHQGRRAALVFHHALVCTSLRLDDIRSHRLMIYRNKLRMIYKALP